MDNLVNFDLGSLLEESKEDVQRQLQIATNELSEARKEIIKQDRIYKENVSKLHYLLHMASQERDEARALLRKMHNMGNKPQGTPSCFLPATSMATTMATTTALSTVAPDQSNTLDSTVPTPGPSSYDPERSAVMDHLAKGRPMPQQGNFLECVMNAWDSVTLAGPLPEWHHPPQVAQAPPVPPVPIQGYIAQTQYQAQAQAQTQTQTQPMYNAQAQTQTQTQTQTQPMYNVQAQAQAQAQAQPMGTVSHVQQELDTSQYLGSLPEWNQPPQIAQAPPVSPVPCSGYNAQNQAQAQAQLMGMASYMLQEPDMSQCMGLSSPTNSEMFGVSSGSSQVPPASNLMDFGDGADGASTSSGSCLMRNASGFDQQITMEKRQRIR